MGAFGGQLKANGLREDVFHRSVHPADAIDTPPATVQIFQACLDAALSFVVRLY